MSHRFEYLSTRNPVHRAFLDHVIDRHKQKVAVERVELPEAAAPVEERVMMRAFSDELNKLAFLGALGSAARAALPWAIGGELAYEGVDRLVNPTAQHRTPLQIAKDVGVSTLLHAPVSVGLKGLDKLRGTAPVGSWSRWLSEKSYGPLSFLGSFFDPKAQAAWRAGAPLIEKALGGEKPQDPTKVPTRSPSAQPVDLSPSYLELRKMDPRAVSARYLT